MAGVTIDIPGVGNVEAKNAATEATLKEILNAIKKGGLSGGGSGGGSAGAGAGAGGGAVAGATKDEVDAKEKSAGMSQRFAQKMGQVAGVAGLVGTALADLTTKTVDLIEDMANVGDSVSAAARTMTNIPVVGGVLAGVFGAVAQAAESTVGAFQQATASGATFGGSINEFARSASAAGMVMADFANLISQNGEAMRLLGGTTEGGAKRFAELSKTMKTSPFMTELNNLGYSTKDVNEGMAGYIKYLGQTGKMGNKSNAELAAGSAKYLKEMDLLAKITGESRKDQEAARQKLLNDAQYQAKIAGMGTDAGEAFANTINGLPAGLRDVAKDIMVTGTATTDEAQKFTALMPKSAALMQKYAAITEAGGTITKDMQQELQNTMAAEGKAQKENMRTQGKYNKEMAGAYMNTVQASNIQTDAIKKGIEAQKNAKATTDGQAAALEGAKRRLAEFSNSFQMALANSGLLDTLMTAFGGLATFVQDVVVPIFQLMAPIISSIVESATALLIPAFEFLGGLIHKYVIPAFFTVADFIEDNVVGVLTAAIITMTPVVAAWVASMYAAVAAQIAAVAPLLVAMAPFVLLGVVIGGLVMGFKKIGGDLQVLGDLFGWVGDSLKQFFLKFQEGIYALLNKIPGMRGDFDDNLKQIAKEQEEMGKRKEERENRISDTMKANREKAAEEDKKKEKTREARDKKYSQMKFGAEKKAIADKAKVEKAAIEKKAEKVSIDYSSPEATAKSFFAQQKSPLAAKKSAPEVKAAAATAKAEATKKSIEADADVKKAEVQKKEAEQKKEEADKGTMPGTTQESAETLLAQLNTNMSELLRITRDNNRVAQKQLNVQEGLSGDVWASPAGA